MSVAYGQDLPVAARRHLHSASALYHNQAPGAQPGCKAVAGYLFGISGELALKQIMRDSGMKPLSQEQRRNDPFYAHFPELKTLLRERAAGRRASEIRRLAEDSTLFQNWNTNMRYAPTTDVQANWVDQWKCRAKELVERMDSQ